MAYEKQTWVNGDVITEEKLNHIEEGIAGCDRGYECIETHNTLFEGEVTTVERQGEASVQIDLEDPKTETLILTIDGVEHMLNRFFVEQANVAFYAESYDFEAHTSSFPAIAIGNISALATETAGTYSVKIETNVEKIEVSDCFGKARGYYPVTSDTELFNGNITTTDNEGDIFGEFQFDDPKTKTITLTLDGVEHVLNRAVMSGAVGYAESIDKSDPQNPVISVPFIWIDSPSGIKTETAGDHSVVITASITSTEVTNDFKNAVAQVEPSILSVVCADYQLDKTFATILGAYKSGIPIVVSMATNSGTVYTKPTYVASNESGGGTIDFHFPTAFDFEPFVAKTDSDYPTSK